MSVTVSGASPCTRTATSSSFSSASWVMSARKSSFFDSKFE